MTLGWGTGLARYGTVGGAGRGGAGRGGAGRGGAGQGLTISAESWTTGELGHIHNLHRKLRPRLPVDASPHHAEGPPTTTTNHK